MNSRIASAICVIIFIILLLSFVASVDAQGIMPFNEIKAGDKCYGLTVFQGVAPEKFDCEVVDIFSSGYKKQILVLLSGGPKDKDDSEILSQTNVFGGMSGSPVYTQEGKIIGAVAITWQYAKKPYAVLTPIEMMVGFRPRILDLPNKLIYDHNPVLDIFSESDGNTSAVPSIKPGETYLFCDYWGYRYSCRIGTATFVDPRDNNIVYTLGHESGGAGGIIALPFWKGRVSAIIPSLASSSKIAWETGPMLGSVMFNGPYGQIVKLGALPKFMPMSITLDNFLQEQLKSNYFFAYTRHADTNIAEAIMYIKNLVDKSLDVDAEIRVNITGLKEIFSFGVIGETTLTGMIVNNFVGEQLDPVIEGVMVTLKARPKYKTLSLEKITASTILTVKGEEFVDVSLVTSNIGGQEFTSTVRLKVEKKFIDKHLQVADGEKAAEDILSQNSGQDVGSEIADLLNKVSDRNALYLYYIEAEGESVKNKDSSPVLIFLSGENLAADESTFAVDTKKSSVEAVKEPPSGWVLQARKPRIQILTKIDLPNKGMLIKGKKDFLVKLAPASNKSVKKNKFWLF